MKKTFLYIAAILQVALAVAYAEDPIMSTAPPSVIFEALALDHDLVTPQWPGYRSPEALVPSPDKTTLFVAEKTAKRIAVIDIRSKKVIKTILFPNEVTGIALSASGTVLYATCSSDIWPDGMVCEASVSSGKIIRHLPAGAGARSPVLSPDGKSLYVCNQYDDNVYCIDIASGSVRSVFESFRHPYSCSLTPDGSTLVIANCIPDQKSTDESTVAAKVVLVDTRRQCVTAVIPLPVGSHSALGTAVSGDGRYAFVTHLVAFFTLPTVTIDSGWIHTNNLAVVDLVNQRLLNDFSLDEPLCGAANPWAVACTRDQKTLCVSHAGSNELTIIDLPKLLSIAQLTSNRITGERGLRFTGCSHDLMALAGIKYRVPVKGKGPRSIALTGRTLFTAGYFGNDDGSDIIEMYRLPPDESAPQPQGTISLGAALPLTATRRGEMIFSDGSICRHSWQSCFSCHPFARADGLNWTLGNDPTSAPRNAKSMITSWWTPPTGWAGKRKHASESIRLGFKNSLFVPTNPVSAACIDTFLMYLRPVPSPYLVKGRLSDAAQKGKEIFFKQPACDCRSCHYGPLFTDMKYHSSRIGYRWDLLPDRDTPSLIEAWRDPPYDHIGSYDTLETLLRYDGHSASSQRGLNDREFSDLVQYVLSL